MEAGRQDLSSLLENVLYKSSVQYHLALSIKSDELDLAIPFLKRIPNNSNHDERGQEILNHLNTDK